MQEPASPSIPFDCQGMTCCLLPCGCSAPRPHGGDRIKAVIAAIVAWVVVFRKLLPHSSEQPRPSPRARSRSGPPLA